MDRVSDSELNGMLAAAKYGHDPETVKRLMAQLLACMDDGIESDENRFALRVLLDYVQHAFRLILEEGVSANQAFGLALQRGKHPREDTTARDIQAASIVVLGMRSGKTWLDAVGDAANQLFPDGKGERAVHIAYSNYKDVLENTPDSFLNDLTEHLDNL